MKKLFSILALCAALCAAPVLAHAQDDTLAPANPPAASGADVAPGLVPDQDRAQHIKEQLQQTIQNMTPEEKAQLQEKLQNAVKDRANALTPEQREKIKNIIQNNIKNAGAAGNAAP